MTQQQEFTQEELSQWVREQFQRANKHLAENGVLFDSVVTEESRYLAPYMAIWKIKSTDNEYFWVISGDLPCDFIPYETEKNARDVVRRISFNWQMKAENIRRVDNPDKTQLEFADLLQSRAEGLYRIYQQDNLWREQVA